MPRIGNRIESKFNNVFNLGIRRGEWVKHNNFLWLTNQQIEKVRDRSRLSEKAKQIEWIVPEEIQLALKNIVIEAQSIDKTELMKEVLKVLNGGIRLTEGIKVIIEKEVDELINANMLCIDSRNIVKEYGQNLSQF